METLTRNCEHPYSFGGTCIVCAKNLDETGVSLRCIHQGLRLNRDEIDRIRKPDMRIMESHRKLYLFLDLDHTLLNTTRINNITTYEHYLMKTLTLEDRESLLLFTMESIGYVTKLRPFVRTFLKEASEMFEMYVYTNASRHYARAMVKLLDPEGVYFGGRIISCEDSYVKYKKKLDVVLVNEEAVLIVDDTKHVWSNKHRGNLIEIERYHFFASSCKRFNLDSKSLSELKMDESESDGALSTVLNVLKRTHCLFFEDTSRKVRSVLKRVQDVNNMSLTTPTEAERLLRMQNEAMPGKLKWIQLSTPPRDKTIKENGKLQLKTKQEERGRKLRLSHPNTVQLRV